MKNLIIALTLLFGLNSNAQSFFDDANAFFNKYVANGKVDYNEIQQNTDKLNKLVNDIAIHKLGTTKNEQLAFYINAYNILAIKNVIDNYPLSSPLDVNGFFDKTTHQVVGENLTLNNIENDIIRPKFNDARIHFVLVCVANGCPKLASQAYKPEMLDRQLEAAARKAINNKSFIYEKGGVLYLSEIFKWYKADFGNTDTDIVSYVNQFLETPLSPSISIDYYNYDWSLNKQ